MKKIIVSLLMFMAMLVFIPMSANAAPQDFTVVNNTGVDVYHLYVSPHSTNNWEEDILGTDVLLAGESLDISFDKSGNAKVWDLMVTDSDGNGLSWSNLNLYEIVTVTLNYDGSTAWADIE